MKIATDKNELLREYDQIVRLIPLLSEATCDLVIQALSNRLAELECSLSLATGRSLKEILAEKKAQLLPPTNAH